MSSNIKRSKANSKPVIKYSLEGKLLKIYDSIDQAAKDHDGSIQNIVTCLKDITNTAYGFQWKYHTENHEQKIKPVKSRIEQMRNKGDAKITMQYSISGELLGIYPSATEASRQTGTNDVSIRCACSGKYKTAGGCQWRYKDSEREVKDLGNYKPPNNTPSPVIKLNEMGFVLGEWKTLTDASKWAGRSRPYISKQCKDTKNYKWNFAKAI